jgi:hypothetical protein
MRRLRHDEHPFDLPLTFTMTLFSGGWHNVLGV